MRNSALVVLDDNAILDAAITYLRHVPDAVALSYVRTLLDVCKAQGIIIVRAQASDFKAIMTVGRFQWFV